MNALQQNVAIVGMALRVPGAHTLDQFWSNLVDGRDCLRRPSRAELERAGVSPQKLSDPSYVAARPVLDGIEYFDTDFFGIPESQAIQMDPGHRLFLECVWEAMEHGGVVPGDNNQKTGVFAGVEVNESSYLFQNLQSPGNRSPGAELTKRLGNSLDYFTLRVSYELNLVGPSFSTMATCSTSLLAVHLAVQNLRLGECTVAVAGGAKVDLPETPIYRAGVDGMLSNSGRVRPFDASADGTIFGNGAAVVVLKLLDDAVRDGNPIHGVIRGTGFCNDGKPADKKSFSAPATSGQKRAIIHALNEAAVDARTIEFVECHGTGTLLGDPTEVISLTEAFREYSAETGYCAVGSVKGNVGHLGSAAGVVSLIKTCLVLTKGIVPPTANFERPNPGIEFAASPFFINTRAMLWQTKGRPKRAGVSAFGFGGANAHVVLEEFVGGVGADSGSGRRHHLLVVSAKTKRALQRRLCDLAIFIEDNPQTSLRDIAHTLQCGRQAMTFRAYVSADELAKAPVSSHLRSLNPASVPCELHRPVVFLFPGRGSETPGMGQGLYENEPVYRETIDYCAEFCENEIGVDLRKKIHCIEGVSDKEAKAALTQTLIAQPALFIVEYALASLFRHWGLRPTAMLGHSLGELVAACHAGVFSLDTGLRLVTLRSRLMQKCEQGSMATVLLPLSRLLDILPDDLDLAAVNSPTRNTVTGPTEAIARFVSNLDADGISSRVLDTSHAFHSRMMDEIVDEFRREVAKLEFNPPTECTISNVTGLPLTDSLACDPNYWVDQLRQTVKFSDGLNNFLTLNNPIFVEMGPERVLSGLVSQHDSARDTVTVLYRPREDVSANAHRLALDSLGLVWSLGADIDFSEFYPQESTRKVSLPTYPFQRFHYWQDLSKPAQESTHKYSLRLYEPGWTKNSIEDIRPAREAGKWLVFADDGGVAEGLIIKLKEKANNITVIESGNRFRRISSFRYEITPGSRQDLQQVISDLSNEGRQGRLRVLHFWTLNENNTPETDLAAFEESCNKGFHTLIALMQAANAHGIGDKLDVQIYVDGLSQVDPSTDALYPDKGVLIGPCLVIPQEIPGLSMRCIDIPGNPYSSSGASLVDEIFNECSLDSDHVLTALRADGRYTEELFELPEIAHGLPRLRYGGTVLITGGVGGLGLKIAEYLYDTLNVRLVLTSRWQAPPREQWPDYVDQDSKIGRALGVLSHLVDRHAEVLIVQADVCIREDMERVVAAATSEFGPIHGIVHTAGILDDGPALQKTRERAEKVFAAKVVSAYILEEIFENEALDMFVYFSSQASLRPSKGQVDYSAANAVLDRLARRRQQNSPGLGCAIGWGAWRDAGMAWEYEGSTLELSSLFQDKIGIEIEDDYRTLSHPILKNYRRYTDGDVLFSGSLKNGEHWITKEHLVGDRTVVSGTTILELFRAGFAQLCPNTDAIEFVRLVLFEKFMIYDTTDYEILYARDGDGYNVELRTRRNGSGATWVLNASVTMREISAAPPVDPIIVEKLLAISEQDVNPCDAMHHGPRWHCAWVGEKDGTGIAVRVRMQDQFHHEIEQFGLHPAIFDRSIHNVTEQLVGPLLPYTCQALRVYGQMPAETLVYGRPSDIEADNAFDLEITDHSGTLLVQIEGYVMRVDTAKRSTERDDSTLDMGSHQHRSMVLGKTGLLSSFEFKNISMPPLQPEEVRIDVKAAGLNFRDVLSALGQLPEGDNSRNMMGSECSGIVIEAGKNVSHLHPGDRVVAVSKNSFSTHVVADAHSVIYLPEALSFTDGASIPITFLTVDYALNQLAQLQAGESVLIHSATGGIGLAAVQMAQQIGAEIFATAGNESKRKYLRDIGVENVMDSRSLDFVAQVKLHTNGEGVDVVLNALAGEFIPASLSLLKPFGRFLEIGKRDIYSDAKLGLYPFRNNLSYFGVDLGQFSMHRPNDLLRMFEKLMQRFATGDLQPSPVKVFTLANISKGFEYMARAQHIGKIVFAVEDNKDPSDVAMDRFRSRFGNGIAVTDGLDVFRCLISSDETPPCVMAAADPLAGSNTVVRHQASTALTRPVDTPYREPRDANEKILKKIWEKSLGVSPIGIDDDFEALGGDSINAIMLQVSVEESLSVELSLAVLFRHPTISKLAKLINEQSASSANN